MDFPKKDTEPARIQRRLTQSGMQEKAVRAEEERSGYLLEQDLYKTLANSSQVGVYILQDRKFQFVNPHIAEYAGYREEEMVGMESLSLIHPDDRRLARKNAIRMLKGQRFSPYEFRIITGDGRIKWIMETSTPIYYRGKRAVLGNSMNITGQKEARNRLEELEALESSILDAIPHAVVGLHNRRFIFANNAVQTVFGWLPEELIGRSVRLIYCSDEDCDKIARLFYDNLEKHRTYSTEFPCRHKDGHELICMMRASRIGERLTEGRIVVTYEDITERKRAEKELEASREQMRNLSIHLQSVREEERARIAREIHDELGQSLTAFKMDLSWLGKRMAAEKGLWDKIKAMSGLVDQTIESVHRISADLRPGLLDDLGLVAAMEWQAKDFSSRSGIICEADLDAEEVPLEKDLATAIFRIFQETLTNVARHANATKVLVRLETRGGKVILEVTDNGRGISRKQINDPKSFGIMGMRERALLWGGDVSVSGSRYRGTTVTVSIPLKAALKSGGEE
ncbi:PAS domain S-box-containing protein [Syntrophus gentianae]|uniref:PAS domain S-box-containing protein n=1 Tax=Syntrophus gentianae TaxID=43775 RepID=A0A1H7WHV5_9BACT|nr:PAS domain-containing sensor histidine kinase [Syntrophus gentianae]SEM20629.1 PAS domain S-box-containing protein [Syntrophus gentianae]